MSFSSDISKFVAKAEENAEKVFRGTALALFKQVILKTPVDKGRLRGNWQTDINKPASGTVNVDSKTGSTAIKEATFKTLKAKLGNSVYMVNNLPYAKAIEDGHSSQAPKGMVKTTVAAFRREINKQARKVNK